MALIGPFELNDLTHVLTWHRVRFDNRLPWFFLTDFPLLAKYSLRQLSIKILPEPQSPRTGLALSDLQSTSSGGYAIGGGGISGLAISTSQSSGSWSTRGVGGVGSGLFSNNNNNSGGSGPSGSGLFGGSSSSSNKGGFNFGSQGGGAGGLFNNCGCSSNDYAALVYVSLSCEGKDNLPSCENIPKLLCCTDRVLEKCFDGCTDYVGEKCVHKLNKFSQASSSRKEKLSSVEEMSDETEKVSPVRQDSDDDLVLLPRRSKSRERVQKPKRIRQHHQHAAKVKQPTGDKAYQLADLPQEEGFIEQKSPVLLTSGHASSHRVPSSSHSIPRSGGDYDLLDSKYPVTEVSDTDLKKDCGTAQSRPPFAPCLPRNTVDELFRSCCQQHVPSNCHSLCTYEHRENVASETLIAAVQQDSCDLKYLSAILYCANQNRDNRKCCEHLGLSNPELGVGERCLRMCNIARSGNTLGTVEKNDLVCLSNWNVLMYCARAGLRTIN